MFKIRIISAALICATFFACTNDELTQEEYLEWLETQYAELKIISESVECSNSDDWVLYEVGYGMCGSNYIPFSKSVDNALLKQKITAYNQAAQKYFEKYLDGHIHCCFIPEPPSGVICIDGKAELDYYNGCQYPVISNSYMYQDAQSEMLNINDIQLIDNCLKVSYASSGCDGSTWAIQLIDSESISKSIPPQRHLKFNFINDEECDAYFEKESSFDISLLKVGTGSVALNIEGWETPIVYE